MANRFYPSISTIVSIDALPEQLSFLKDGLSSVLDKIYFKDLQVVKSPGGDSAFYNLKLIFYKSVSFKIPGSDIELAVNPDFNASGLTEIPITVSYEWGILKLINGFDIEQFSTNPLEIFNIITQTILGITPKELVKRVINKFINQQGLNANPVDTFIHNINTKYNSSINPPMHPVLDTKISQAIALVTNTLEKDIFRIIYEVFIDNTNSQNIEQNLKDLFIDILGESPTDYIKRLIIPKINANLAMKASIIFPRNVLQPIDNQGQLLAPEIRSMLSLAEARFSFSSTAGIGFNSEVAASLNHPSMIGNTGFSIALNTVKVDLSKTKNIPEATADGRGLDFVGVFIKEVEIGLPPIFKDSSAPSSDATIKVIGKNLLIGTGGVSGSISLLGSNLNKSFGGGFSVSFNKFDVNFQQNTIINSNISGTMKIPGFKDNNGNDAAINIDVNMMGNGDFSITASGEQSIPVLKMQDIFNLNVESISAGSKDGKFFVAVSGELAFEDLGGTIGNLLPDKIDIKKLIIWENGKIEFERGNILPNNITLNLGVVEIAVSDININTYEKELNGLLRQYHAFEFNGHIKSTAGGIDARGDSIKFFYTVDNNPAQNRNPHHYISIQSINVNIIIPSTADKNTAAVLIDGYLSIKNPSQGNSAGTEYSGNINFTLPKLKMQGSAAMRANPQNNSFIIDAGFEMPTPILLGATGLGIYGFRGLIGQKYVAKKSAAGLNEDARWWEYYKAKVAPENKEGVYIGKFQETNGFSLGAGVSLATAGDGGRTFSSKLFFLLSLPEVFLLQGQGQILKDRVGLDTTNDPPFFAQIAIDKTSIQAAFGVSNYLIPNDKDGGKIAKVSGIAEMGFFFNNSSAWYLNIGRDTPENKRVNVRLLELFDAYFYLMVSGKEIKAGAGAKFNTTKNYRAFKAELSAYLDITGKIAFKPKQYGASISLGGRVGIYILGCGFSISVDASLSAEAPQPFIVTGSLKACIRFLRKDRCAEFTLSWIKNSNLDTSEIELMERSKAAMALNMLTNETFPLYSANNLQQLNTTVLDNYSIPMDSYIDMEFLKGVHPSQSVINKIGGNTQTIQYVEYVSPQKAKSSQIRHEFYIDELNIYIWSDNQWKIYDIYEASTPLHEAPFVTTDLSNLKIGYWQYQQPKIHNKLRLLAQTPLNFLSQSSGEIIMEELNIDASSIYCPPNTITKTCINFQSYGNGFNDYQILGQFTKDKVYPYKGLLFRVIGNNGLILHLPEHNIDNALHVEHGDSLEIIFPHSSSYIQLYLGTSSEYITIDYYAKIGTGNFTRENLPEFIDKIIYSRSYHREDLSNSIIYDDINLAIDKIIITSQECDIVINNNVRVNEARKLLSSRLDNVLNHLILTEYNNNSYDIATNLREVLDKFTPYILSSKDSDVIVENISIITPNDITLELSINYSNKISKKIRLISAERIEWRDIREFNSLNFLDNQNFEININTSNGDTSGKGEISLDPIYTPSSCSLLLYQVCYLKFSDHQQNNTTNHLSIQNEINTLTEGINKSIQPIWRPNSYFAIEVKTKDLLYKDNSMEQIAHYNKSYIYGFKTIGPIGFFHQENDKYIALLANNREAEFKLAKLQNYIDFNKSYPNADGHLINAKPLFYIEPELKLSYTQNYVYEFYRTWDSYKNTSATELDLITLIKDPAISENPLAPITVEWVKNDEPDLRLDINTLNNLASNGRPCVHTAALELIGLHSITSIPTLQPLKIYTAIFKARSKFPTTSTVKEEDVHSYVFQTSRYGNFEEQVNSYILETDEQNNITKIANFEISIDASSQDLSTANAIINNTLDNHNPLRQEYACDFDKLIYGVFKLKEMHPAATTEFNIIRNSITNKVIGLLIRNPEPFNDPKIEKSYLYSSIEAYDNNIRLANKILSKDAREIFISNTDFHLMNANYDFNFKYLKWNGSTYSTESTVTFSITLITEPNLV